MYSCGAALSRYALQGGFSLNSVVEFEKNDHERENEIYSA